MAKQTIYKPGEEVYLNTDTTYSKPLSVHEGNQMPRTNRRTLQVENEILDTIICTQLNSEERYENIVLNINQVMRKP